MGCAGGWIRIKRCTPGASTAGWEARSRPLPYGQLVEYTQGYGLDNEALGHDLQEQLRVICVMLLKKQI